MNISSPRFRWLLFLLLLAGAVPLQAGEADIKIPDLSTVPFTVLGTSISGYLLMYSGIVGCALGTLYGWMQYRHTCALPVHSSMRDVSNIIWETCKTYLTQQGKFLAALWILIAVCIVYYFLG